MSQGRGKHPKEGSAQGAYKILPRGQPLPSKAAALPGSSTSRPITGATTTTASVNMTSPLPYVPAATGPSAAAVASAERTQATSANSPAAAGRQTPTRQEAPSPKQSVPTPPRRRSLTKEQQQWQAPSAPSRPTSASTAPTAHLSPSTTARQPTAAASETDPMSLQHIRQQQLDEQRVAPPQILRPTSGQAAFPQRNDRPLHRGEHPDRGPVPQGMSGRQPYPPRNNNNNNNNNNNKYADRSQSSREISDENRLPEHAWPEGSLNQMLDRKMSVSLRDGRIILGVLRSYDQFHNLLLTESIERLFAIPTSPSHSKATSALASSSSASLLALAPLHALAAGSPSLTSGPPHHTAKRQQLASMPYDQWPSYADVPRGNYIVRGENIVVIGEVDEDAEVEAPLKGPIDMHALVALRKQYADNSAQHSHPPRTPLTSSHASAAMGPATTVVWDDADML